MPEPFLGPGAHRLEIERAGQPPATPFVLDSVGLRLLGSGEDRGGLRLSLAGPGRAWVRFHAPTAPVVVDAGRRLDCRWDAATGLGWVEVSRGEEAGEFRIDCVG